MAELLFQPKAIREKALKNLYDKTRLLKTSNHISPRTIHDRALDELHKKNKLIKKGEPLPPTETELFRAYLDELVPTKYDMYNPNIISPDGFGYFHEDPVPIQASEEVLSTRHPEKLVVRAEPINELVNEIVSQNELPAKDEVKQEPSHRLPPIK